MTLKDIRWTLEDFFRFTKTVDDEYFHRYPFTTRPRLMCSDGFSMSVQGSEFHYCWPRKTNLGRYDEVEVGFPSKEEILLMAYAEDPEKPCETVYDYVPWTIIEEIVAKHGGIDEGAMYMKIHDWVNDNLRFMFKLSQCKG